MTAALQLFQLNLIMCNESRAISPIVKMTTRALGGIGWLLICLCSSLAVAQSQPTSIEFTDNIDFVWEPPANLDGAQHIEVEAAALYRLSVGNDLRVQLNDEKFANLSIVEVGSYINGDRVIRALGEDGAQVISLSLTISQLALYGHFSSSEGNLQIYATGADGIYEGWLYKPGSLGDSSSSFQNDYTIPEYQQPGTTVLRPVAEIRSTLPLKIGQQPSSLSDAAPVSVAEIDDSNFTISQVFSNNPVLAGSSVEARLDFENTSNEWHYGLFVEIFFLLENTELLDAPAQCQQQFSLSLQSVLYCELGDFAPGESKSFNYIVATTEQSKPSILSTPIVGNVRLDTYVNVVDDVVSDSDADGISDFNESLLNTDPNDPDSVDFSNTVIDVMAFYTPGASALYPQGVATRINQLISVANQIYADSGVAITLRPVFHGEVDYNDSDDMDTALQQLINKSDPAFAAVDELRARYGGDLVMLFRPLGLGAARCGLSPVGGFNTNGDFSAPEEVDYAYSHIAIDCPTDIAVAHELGHNMGLTHSHVEDGTGGTFDFSTGYGVDAQFVTLMAFPAAFNTETRIAQFSNPRMECLGFVCGVDSADEFGADAVQSLNIVRHQIANFLPSTVPDMPVLAVAAASGATTNAIIALAASSDDGLSYNNTVTPGYLVDIVADITIDDRHVNMQGSLHILIGLEDGNFFQIDRSGNVVSWDGSIAGMLPIIDVGPLRKREYLNVLEDIQFDSSLLGRTIFIYVAYVIPATEEIVYTVDPLLLNVKASPTGN